MSATKLIIWRNYLNGLYVNRRREKYLVPGQVHHNLLREGGDSLQGRYTIYGFIPLSLQGIENTLVR